MNEILLESENFYFNRRPVSEFSDWQKKKASMCSQGNPSLTKVDDDGKPWENCYPPLSPPSISYLSIATFILPSTDYQSITSLGPIPCSRSFFLISQDGLRTRCIDQMWVKAGRNKTKKRRDHSQMVV
jgi:hypothetical protein